MTMKKKVLGRGLGALMGSGGAAAVTAEDAAHTVGARFFRCPIEKIRPNKRQPRKHFAEAALKELADSIREKGVIEPLIVRKDGVDYELIAGERRWRASTIAGLKDVPVVVTDATDEESLEFAIIENIQREDLNPMEEAEAYEALVNMGLSQEEVAKRVGKERATVANYLRLNKLPFEIKEEVVKGAVSMGHARAILSLHNHAAQRELCKKVVTKGLSVRETEKLAARTLNPKKAAAAAKTVEYASIEEDLRKVFGTKVVVTEKNGKGRIEIEFYSADERERLLELLKSLT